MKKILIPLVAFILIAGIYSCHDTKPKDPSATADTVAATPRGGEKVAVFVMDTLTGDTDTVYVKPGETVIKLPVDREEKAKQEAAEQERALAAKARGVATQGARRQTADQSLFDIKGPVKSLNYPQGFTASYNQIVYIPEQRDLVTLTHDGRWLPSSRYIVRRDARGRVIRLTRKSDNIVNEFTYKGNLVATVKVYAAAKKNVYSIARIERAKSGLVSGYNATIVFAGDNGRQRVSVKILQRDSHGNWTRRRFKTDHETRIEERVIEYRK